MSFGSATGVLSVQHSVPAGDHPEVCHLVQALALLLVLVQHSAPESDHPEVVLLPVALA